MRTLIHLSDLHFGRTDPVILPKLIDTVHAVKPDLVVVSGDLTQRARSAEFISARAFLDALPSPRLVVPGNHDIPLHNVFQRFFSPLKKYRQHISNNLAPLHIDSEIAVAGINTARSLTIKNGRVNTEQIEALRSAWQTVDASVIKIVVTHHPFDVPDANEDQALVGRAEPVMSALAELHVDMLMAGHHHLGSAENSATSYPYLNHASIVVQAGTATSTRQRGQTNSFNLIRIEAARIAVERFDWMSAKQQFLPATRSEFVRGEQGWVSTTDPR